MPRENRKRQFPNKDDDDKELKDLQNQLELIQSKIRKKLTEKNNKNNNNNRRYPTRRRNNVNYNLNGKKINN